MVTGTICSCLGFPFIFIPCWFCVGVPDWAQFIYYVPLIVIFQFGWACAQIGHLALIPEMTFSTAEKVQLNGWRSEEKNHCSHIYQSRKSLIYM